MEMTELQVLHFPKENSHQLALVPNIFGSRVVEIDTCQRQLFIWNGEPPMEFQNGAVHWRGIEAYHFLLRFGCGLESALVGEPDVFGQLKDAWSQFQKKGVKDPELDTFFQRLFEDIKEVRSRFLQNLGSQTYGCLTRQTLRKFLLENPSLQKKPLLFLGAGNLAQAVAPLLWNLQTKENLVSSFFVYNRSESRLNPWLKQWPSGLSVFGFSDFSKLTELRCDFSGVVSTLPDDPCLETNWAKYLLEIPHSVPLLLLGSLTPQSSEWKKRPAVFGLSHLLQTQADTSQERTLKITLAKKACEERARFRNMSPRTGLGVPHSWEDLVHFAF